MQKLAKHMQALECRDWGEAFEAVSCQIFLSGEWLANVCQSSRSGARAGPAMPLPPVRRMDIDERVCPCVHPTVRIAAAREDKRMQPVSIYDRQFEITGERSSCYQLPHITSILQSSVVDFDLHQFWFAHDSCGSQRRSEKSFKCSLADKALYRNSGRMLRDLSVRRKPQSPAHPGPQSMMQGKIEFSGVV